MLNRSITFVTAVALFAGASHASAGMLGMPMNLKFALESSTTVFKSHAQEPADGACYKPTRLFQDLSVLDVRDQHLGYR